MAKSE